MVMKRESGWTARKTAADVLVKGGLKPHEIGHLARMAAPEDIYLRKQLDDQLLDSADRRKAAQKIAGTLENGYLQRLLAEGVKRHLADTVASNAGRAMGTLLEEFTLSEVRGMAKSSAVESWKKCISGMETGEVRRVLKAINGSPNVLEKPREALGDTSEADMVRDFGEFDSHERMLRALKARMNEHLSLELQGLHPDDVPIVTRLVRQHGGEYAGDPLNSLKFPDVRAIYHKDKVRDFFEDARLLGVPAEKLKTSLELESLNKLKADLDVYPREDLEKLSHIVSEKGLDWSAVASAGFKAKETYDFAVGFKEFGGTAEQLLKAVDAELEKKAEKKR
jgi:hypothetical protein